MKAGKYALGLFLVVMLCIFVVKVVPVKSEEPPAPQVQAPAEKWEYGMLRQLLPIKDFSWKTSEGTITAESMSDLYKKVAQKQGILLIPKEPLIEDFYNLAGKDGWEYAATEDNNVVHMRFILFKRRIK